MLVVSNKINSSEMQYICPDCRKKGSYFGANAPISCGSCHVLLPDLAEMLFDVSERKKYHLNEGFFKRCF
jgi:coenzyme F420-reducing hydrogenase gamma subunit